MFQNYLIAQVFDGYNQCLTLSITTEENKPQNSVSHQLVSEYTVFLQLLRPLMVSFGFNLSRHEIVLLMLTLMLLILLIIQGDLILLYVVYPVWIPRLDLFTHHRGD